MSTGNIILLICLVLPVLIATTIAFGKLYYSTKRVETGQFGAFGLGVFGMLWTQIIIPLIIIYLMAALKLKITNSVVSIIYNMILEGVLVSLGILWGVYITNNRGEKSMPRSVIVGLGFGFAASVVYQYKFILAIFYAIKSNMGMTIPDNYKTMISKISYMDAMLTTFRCLALIIIYVFFAYLLALTIMKKEKLGRVTAIIFLAAAMIRLAEELLLKISWGSYIYTALLIAGALWLLRYLFAQDIMSIKPALLNQKKNVI